MTKTEYPSKRIIQMEDISYFALLHCRLPCSWTVAILCNARLGWCEAFVHVLLCYLSKVWHSFATPYYAHPASEWFAICVNLPCAIVLVFTMPLKGVGAGRSQWDACGWHAGHICKCESPSKETAAKRHLPAFKKITQVTWHQPPNRQALSAKDSTE